MQILFRVPCHCPDTYVWMVCAYSGRRRFFTVIRMIDVTCPSNLLMFGEENAAAYDVVRIVASSKGRPCLARLWIALQVHQQPGAAQQFQPIGDRWTPSILPTSATLKHALR